MRVSSRVHALPALSQEKEAHYLLIQDCAGPKAGLYFPGKINISPPCWESKIRISSPQHSHYYELRYSLAA